MRCTIIPNKKSIISVVQKLNLNKYEIITAAIIVIITSAIAILRIL